MSVRSVPSVLSAMSLLSVLSTLLWFFFPEVVSPKDILEEMQSLNGHICREVGGCTQENWRFSNLIEPPTCLEVGAYLTTCARITVLTTLND